MELHPEAQKRIDEMAAGLVHRVVRKNIPPQNGFFFTEKHVPVKIDEKQIIGDLDFHLTDHKGDVVARWFIHADEEYCLEADAYVELRRVCERVTKAPAYSSTVSMAFIEKHLFEWVKETFRGAEARLFTTKLQSAASEAVRPTTVWLPVTDLVIERPFQFGQVTFRMITKAMIDSWKAIEVTVADDQQRAMLDRHFEKMRARFQGHAAVVFHVNAEEGFARARALELAEVAIGLLKLHSPGAISPWLTTTGALLGSEYRPKHDALVEQGRGWVLHHTALTKNVSPTWRIYLRKELYLGALARMSDEHGLNEYQRRLRKALLTFGKAATLYDLNDRLVFVFSALEGLLLKDSSEPIQHYLGERMAFIATEDPDERIKVVDVVKKAYALRSAYIHHQVGVDDASLLEQFQLDAWKVMYACVHHFNTHKSVADLLALIERKKFGGN